MASAGSPVASSSAASSIRAGRSSGASREQPIESQDGRVRIAEIIPLDAGELAHELAPPEGRMGGRSEALDLPLVGRSESGVVAGGNQLGFDGLEGTRHLGVILDGGLVQGHGALGVVHALATQARRIDQCSGAEPSILGELGDLHGHGHGCFPRPGRLVDGPQTLEQVDAGRHEFARELERAARALERLVRHREQHFHALGRILELRHQPLEQSCCQGTVALVTCDRRAGAQGFRVRRLERDDAIEEARGTSLVRLGSRDVRQPVPDRRSPRVVRLGEPALRLPATLRRGLEVIGCLLLASLLEQRVDGLLRVRRGRGERLVERSGRFTAQHLAAVDMEHEGRGVGLVGQSEGVGDLPRNRHPGQ